MYYNRGIKSCRFGCGEKFLRAAAVYGANASGKSNLYLAMSYFQRIIIESLNNVSDHTESAIHKYYIPNIITEQKEKLIEVTDRIVKEAKIVYQNIWVVFDKDDFADFDQAIAEGAEKGYKIAWSNQSFEYWLYLHFYYSDSALHREEWCAKLDEIFRKHRLGELKYQKIMKIYMIW